jgi:hypothetical protein
MSSLPCCDYCSDQMLVCSRGRQADRLATLLLPHPKHTIDQARTADVRIDFAHTIRSYLLPPFCHARYNINLLHFSLTICFNCTSALTSASHSLLTHQSTFAYRSTQRRLPSFESPKVLLLRTHQFKKVRFVLYLRYFIRHFNMKNLLDDNSLFYTIPHASISV